MKLICVFVIRIKYQQQIEKRNRLNFRSYVNMTYSVRGTNGNAGRQ